MAETILALAIALFGAVGAIYNFLGEPFFLLGDIGDVPLAVFFTFAGAYGYMN